MGAQHAEPYSAPVSGYQRQDVRLQSLVCLSSTGRLLLSVVVPVMVVPVWLGAQSTCNLNRIKTFLRLQQERRSRWLPAVMYLITWFSRLVKRHNKAERLTSSSLPTSDHCSFVVNDAFTVPLTSNLRSFAGDTEAMPNGKGFQIIFCCTCKKDLQALLKKYFVHNASHSVRPKTTQTCLHCKRRRCRNVVNQAALSCVSVVETIVMSALL